MSANKCLNLFKDTFYVHFVLILKDLQKYLICLNSSWVTKENNFKNHSFSHFVELCISLDAYKDLSRPACFVFSLSLFLSGISLCFNRAIVWILWYSYSCSLLVDWLYQIVRDWEHCCFMPHICIKRWCPKWIISLWPELYLRGFSDLRVYSHTDTKEAGVKILLVCM